MTSTQTNSKRWLPIGLAILVVALATLGWSIWHTRYAWQAGNGSLPAARADPRLLTAGDMTTFHIGFKPFSQPADNLPWQYAQTFEVGEVANPPEDLGPLYNASACGARRSCGGLA